MSKVLIVEDELSIAELEKDYLELSSFTKLVDNCASLYCSSKDFICSAVVISARLDPAILYSSAIFESCGNAPNK